MEENRLVHLYNFELDRIKKQDGVTNSPSAVDHVEFKADIIELRSFGFDVLVVLENLEIFYIYVSPHKLIKSYAGKTSCLTDAQVQRIKYTSLCISNKYDFGLLSIFLNSLIVLYITKKTEESKAEEDMVDTDKLVSNTLKIESTYEYYDFHVNSSLILFDHGKEGEYIWHVDDEHRVIKSKINRYNSKSIEILHDDSQIILTDKSIIDINQFNNEHLILLQRNWIQFLNVKDWARSNKIILDGQDLISTHSLFNGTFEDTINFIGVNSVGKWVKFDMNYKKQIFTLSKVTLISEDHSWATSIALSSINRNKYILYIGTSFGTPTLSTFSKAENEQVKIYQFNETYGWINSMWMDNNLLKFSYGVNSTKIQTIGSSSHKLLAKWSLEYIFNALSSVLSTSDPNKEYANSLEGLLTKNSIILNMKVFPMKIQSIKKSEKKSNNFEEESKSTVLIFLAITNFTLVLKFDLKGYHIEVIQFIEINYKDVFQTSLGYIFVLDSETAFISHNDLIWGNFDKITNKAFNVR